MNGPFVPVFWKTWCAFICVLCVANLPGFCTSATKSPQTKSEKRAARSIPECERRYLLAVRARTKILIHMKQWSQSLLHKCVYSCVFAFLWVFNTLAGFSTSIIRLIRKARSQSVSDTSQLCGLGSKPWPIWCSEVRCDLSSTFTITCARVSVPKILSHIMQSSPLWCVCAYWVPWLERVVLCLGRTFGQVSWTDCIFSLMRAPQCIVL